MIKLVMEMIETTQTRYLDFIEDNELAGWVFLDREGLYAFQSLKKDKEKVITFH